MLQEGIGLHVTAMQSNYVPIRYVTTSVSLSALLPSNNVTNEEYAMHKR